MSPLLTSERTVSRIVDMVPSELAVALVFLSFLGSIWVIGPATIAAYWADRSERSIGWLAIIIGCYAVVVAIKPIFSVPRPEVEPPIDAAAFPAILDPLYHTAVSLDSESFPSGHAIAATVFWGLVAIDVRIGPRWGRLLVAGGLIAFIAWIRIALGTHYVADVIIGILVGAGYLVAVLALKRWVPRPNRALFLTAFVLTLVATIGGRTLEGINLLGAVLGAVLVLVHTDQLEVAPVTDRTMITNGCLLGVAIGVAALLVTKPHGVPWFLSSVAIAISVVALPMLVLDRR